MRRSLWPAHACLFVQGRPAARLWPEGVTVVAATYVLGMLLRAVSGRGLAPAFLVVAGLSSPRRSWAGDSFWRFTPEERDGLAGTRAVWKYTWSTRPT
jgi:hypothetical protein